jgi:sulfur-carrier protein
MTYLVNYFGLLAERRGLAEESVTTRATTPAALYAELDATHRLGLKTEHFRAAVNDEFTAWDLPLHDGDRIALLPPLSGG